VHVLALASDEPATSAPSSDAGDVLDERATRQYKLRLVDIEADLAEAERDADHGRASRLRHEKAALEDELRRAIGKGGRARRDKSASERARVNVQRRVRDAIGRISDVDGELGKYFERHTNTGTFCCFRG
jgi:hypothetical protein